MTLPLFDDLPERERLLRKTWERLDPPFRTPNQVLGRRSTIGCVALEITQRCNLDCTLCYLSESAESVPDPPLEVLFERIARIRETYGAGVGVQVTGGDPTLRRREELVAIVRRAAEAGLRPALMTNGIRATRDLLAELAEAGLFDVAFHVDTTQRRNRYPTEEALNAVRREYIERARGLKLAVVFNTTVHAGNLEEIPELVRFFLANSDTVGMASFQVQASTGRGQWRERSPHVHADAVAERIRRGVGLPSLAWDTAVVGHPGCNRGTMLATIGDRAVDVLTDRPLFEAFLEEFRHVAFDRRDVTGTTRRVIAAAFRKPSWVLRGGAFLAKKLWPVRRELLAGGCFGKMTFFIHSFMDADGLDPERIRNCAFMVMTDEGPVSMCEVNSRRDDYILPRAKGLPVHPSASAATAASPQNRPGS
ncbi:MAG TPA: radical SAM protein [Thermoanaerobaculia bacterium]|nr:radical SAM protein [Thermoanaerobaculia bacterium]